MPDTLDHLSYSHPHIENFIHTTHTLIEDMLNTNANLHLTQYSCLWVKILAIKILYLIF